MTEFEKILKLADDETVSLGKGFKDVLHKKLCLGGTRYMVRYGTLSEGHGHVTDTHRYYQAIKEAYNMANSIWDYKVLAMEAQADLIEAEDKKDDATTKADHLRADAAIMRAQGRLRSALVSMEDIKRQLDECIKVYKELSPTIDTKYPEGIEQAQPDMWQATYEYEKMRGHNDQSWRIPLMPEHKAKLGLEFKCMESLAPLIIQHKDKFEQIANEDPDKLVKFINQVTSKALLEDKH